MTRHEYLDLPGDLALRLEREIDRDRRFEARRPDRSYWVRRLGKAESEVNRLIAGQITPSGMRGFVVVRKVCPGGRIRGFFFASPDFEPDMSDERAESLWRHVSRRRE